MAESKAPAYIKTCAICMKITLIPPGHCEFGAVFESGNVADFIFAGDKGGF